MNGFNEAFIKAAFDKKKLSLITEYAKICYPDSPEVHVSFYPGDGIRMFKNNDAINILCPSELSPIQESNLTRSLAMGDLFDDADNIENTASYVVNTTLPVNGMINKGMNTPDNLKKIVAVTIGKMNDDNGKFELNNTDVENGTNIIGDLLKTDSSNFKNIKNVVDDYLGNDEHSYGYDIDFSKDIDKLKKEINDIKEEDINPEDSISDEDWDDEWEINEDSGVTPNDNFAGGFSAAYDKLQAGGGLQQEAESDEDDTMESCCRGNGDCCTTEDDDLSDEYCTQEGAIETLRKIGYDPKTRTFITDIPDDEGDGAKMRCKLKIGGLVAMTNGPCFERATSTIHIPLKSLLGNSQEAISSLKHEEGHLYISKDKSHFSDDFANAEKLVDRHSASLSAHGNFPEEYVADLYAAKHAGDNGAGMIKWLINADKKNIANCEKLKKKFSENTVKKIFSVINKIDKSNIQALESVKQNIHNFCDSFLGESDEMVKLLNTMFRITPPGDQTYRQSQEAARDNINSKTRKAYEQVKQSITVTDDVMKKALDNIHNSGVDSLASLEREILTAIHNFQKSISAFEKANTYETKARIYFIKKYINADLPNEQQSVQEFEIEDDYSDDLDTSPDGSDDHNPVLATESFTLKSAEEFFNEFDEEIDDGDDAVEETERPYDDYLKLHNYDPKSNTVEINGQRINAGKQPSNSKERNRMNKFLRENKYNPKDGTIQTTMQNADGSYIRRPFTMNYVPTRLTDDGKVATGRPAADTHNRRPFGKVYDDEINFGNQDLYSKPQFSNMTLNHEVGHGVSRRIQDDIKRGVDNAQTRKYLQAKKNAEEHLQNLDDETKNELKDWDHSNSEELYADLYGTQQNPYYKDADPESVERSVRNDQGPRTTRDINNIKNADLSRMRKAHNKDIRDDLAERAKEAPGKIDKYKNMSDEELQKKMDDDRSFFNSHGFDGERDPYKNTSLDDYRKEQIRDQQDYIDQNELFKKSPNEWRKKYGDYDLHVVKERARARGYDGGIKANEYEGKSRGDFVLNPEYNNVDTSYRQPSESEYKAAERDMNKKRGLDENDEKIYAPKKQYSPQMRSAAENKLKPLQDKYDKTNNEYRQIARELIQKYDDPSSSDEELDRLEDQTSMKRAELRDLDNQINSTPEGRILKYTGPKYKPPKKEEESSGPNESISSFNNVVRQKPAKGAKHDTKTQQEGFLLKKPKKLKAIPIRDLVSYITVELNAIQDSNDQAMLAGYTCSKLEIVDFYINCIDTQDDRYIVPHTRQYLVDGQKQLNSLLTKILQIKPINKGNRLWQLTNVSPII